MTTKTVQISMRISVSSAMKRGVPFSIIFLKLGFIPCMVELSFYEAWSHKKKKHEKD